MPRARAVLLAATLAVLSAGTATATTTAASDPARAELRGIVENVAGATGKRYSAKDDAGHVMDTVKIIQDSTGGYLAVSHHMAGDGHFRVNLATSTDLLNWHWVRELAGSNTGPASQPTIVQASNGGFVLAWEQEQPGGGNNYLAFRYFANRADLLAGKVNRSFDAPRRLSSCAEGTPNIYSVTLSPDIDHSTIDIGGHYWWNCDRDRQQRGTLKNFNSWTTAAQPNFDNALLYWNVGGNIGDRDQTTFRGYSFGLIEGQYTKGDFGSWRTFVYDYQTGNADRTTIRTNGGSTAFANPSITALKAPQRPERLRHHPLHPQRRRCPRRIRPTHLLPDVLTPHPPSRFAEPPPRRRANVRTTEGPVSGFSDVAGVAGLVSEGSEGLSPVFRTLSVGSAGFIRDRFRGGRRRLHAVRRRVRCA